MKNTTSLIVAAIVALLGFALVTDSWYTIDQGERGVILRNGAITGTAEPGLGFKLPFFDSVSTISIQSKSRLYESVAAYSRDQQPAFIVMSVNYRLPTDQVAEIYTQYGGEDGVVSRLIDRRVFEQVKNVFGQFNAVTAIQERARLNAEVQTAIQTVVSGPVIIESVQIENIDFSDAYESSIEQRMLAEVEVQKLKQNAEREKVQAEIVVTQAQAQANALVANATAEAQAVKLRAEADAYGIELRGKAEAVAIDQRGQALRDNPGVVALVQAEKWDGALPTTMPPNGTVPFLSLQ